MRSSRFRDSAVAGVGAAIFVVASLLAGSGIALVDAAGRWTAPAEVQAHENPLPHSDATVMAGKAIYKANCAVCHGDRGRGKGPAASALTPRPHPFTAPHIAHQPDGALFWKVTTGRAPMPAWGNNLTEEERWKVIHYLHTLIGPARAPVKKPGGG